MSKRIRDDEPDNEGGEALTPVPGYAYVDTGREIRSMVMAVFPSPPLPMMASGCEDGSLLTHQRVASSHDLIARLLTNCEARADAQQDLARHDLQRAAQTLLCDRIDLLEEGDTQGAYDAFAEFTRAYVDSYLNGAPSDVRVLPMEQVMDGSHVHAQALDHAIAHDEAFGECRGITCKSLAGPSYTRLVAHAALRIASSKE
jgi:hypothetical protein